MKKEAMFQCIKAPLRRAFAAGKRYVTTKNRKDFGKALAANLAMIAVALGAIFLIGYQLSLEPAYALTLNGEEVGYVDSNRTVSGAITAFERQMSEVLGQPYRFDGEMEYRFATVSREDILTREQCLSVLEAYADECYTEACFLYLDGERVAAAADQATIEEVLDSLLLQQNEQFAADGETIEIHNYIRIEEGYCHRSEVLTAAHLYLLLSGENEEALNSLDSFLKTGESHSPAPAGQTLLSISLSDSRKVSPELRPLEGGELKTSTRLTFVTVSFQEETVEVPFKTVYLDSDEYYEGVEVVESEGAVGLAHREYLVRRVDGRVVSKEMVTEDFEIPVQNRVVLRGTKERKATGSFVWPVKGLITSYYGGRYIFGAQNSHTGIDIDADLGDPFVASDGGVVVYAGNSGSTYGYLTVIDHGNGYKTYYAHQSEILVAEGDRVYQGQIIGLVGNTGRVTGSHMHFELRWNGERTDPMNVLPKMYD